jgi:hypothetical protein
VYLESQNVKLFLVIFQGTLLLQLGKSFHGVIVGTPAKPDLNSSGEIRPRRDLFAGLELLEPNQGFSIHVEGENWESLSVRCAIHFKELLSPTTPSFRIFPIETREFQPNGLGFEALPGMRTFQKGMGLIAQADWGRVRERWLRMLKGMFVWGVGFRGY